MKKLGSIILIDDDEISNSLNQITIEEIEVANELLSFTDGEEAINYLKSRSGKNIDSIELLIVDLNMPGLDGEEFVLEYNALPEADKNRIKVVIYSAILPGKKYQYLKDLGVVDFIEKPLTPEKITQLIERLGICVSLS